MTYCVGLLLDQGIVLLSDTRTNAGIDNLASYRKTFLFEAPGEKVVAIMTAGSLSVTQTAIARLEEAAASEANPQESILQAPTMFQTANIVGRVLSEVTAEIRAKMDGNAAAASATLILAGQRAGGPMRMYLIYPEGNFIEASEDTPYLQIGEHKYGKPILDRVIRPDTSLTDAKKAVLLSMDSTLRSNLSVGMPLDLTVIEKDALRVTEARRFEAEDPAFQQMSRAWSKALRDAYTEITV